MRLTTSCNLRTDEFLWNYAIQTKDKMWNTPTDLHKSSNDKKQITLHQKLKFVAPVPTCFTNQCKILDAGA